MIQHKIPEIVNLQMERFLFAISVLLGFCVSMCLSEGGDQWKNL
jgi:hypothetical protein